MQEDQMMMEAAGSVLEQTGGNSRFPDNIGNAAGGSDDDESSWGVYY
jgi:hypothetical protein